MEHCFGHICQVFPEVNDMSLSPPSGWAGTMQEDLDQKEKKQREEEIGGGIHLSPEADTIFLILRTTGFQVFVF